MRYIGNYVSTGDTHLKRCVDELSLPVVKEAELAEWSTSKEAFWADFRPRANFSVLRKMLLADNEGLDRLALDFLKLVSKTSYSAPLDRLFLMKCFGPVDTHVDPPYRNTAFNWYPFETHDCTLVFGNQRYSPKQGDILLLDVTQPHRVDQNTDAPVYIMSL